VVRPRKSIAAILKEVMTNEVATLLDTNDAHNKAMMPTRPSRFRSDRPGLRHATVTV
jgi:hypothetical protein